MNVLEGEVREHTSGSVVLAVQGVGYLHLPLTAEAPTAQRLAASFRPHTVQIGEQRLTADQPHLAGLSPFPAGAPESIGLEPPQVRLLAA